jgi:DNA-binding MarR family transcriptional regulator
MKKQLSQPDYESLAELRRQIRCFLHFSEQAARNSGLEPHQHQFLLTVRGLPARVRPRVGEIAERLQIRHNTAVELANRLVHGDYIRRHRRLDDRREVLLSLTPKGERILRQLSLHHKNELHLQGPLLLKALRRVMQHAPATRRHSRAVASAKLASSKTTRRHSRAVASAKITSSKKKRGR